MHELTTLQIERVTDRVHELLREHILNGTFRPGEKLNVEQLAKQLCVSQTPVKSALALLASEGLVRIRPRHGTFVAVFSAKEIADVLAIRRALELLAAETVIEHITPENLNELSALAQRIHAATDVDEHYHDNSEFHQRLVELSGNFRLAEQYHRLNAHVQIALVHARNATWRGRVEAEEREHRAILDALAQRDTAAFREAITHHLDRACQSLLHDLDARAPEGQP